MEHAMADEQLPAPPASPAADAERRWTVERGLQSSYARRTLWTSTGTGGT